MVDIKSKQRTHYDVLGLTPGATSEAIEQAFARQFGCFQPQTVGQLADVTVAYEALRSPDKRRAYDASLGIEPEDAPRRSPVTWRIGGQVMTATATPARRPAVEQTATPEPHVELEPRASEATPFIAASLRDLASPEPLHERLEARTRPEVDPPEAEPKAPTEANEEHRINLALNNVRGNAEEGDIPWKRAGIVVGSIAAAVALLGAWAGWESVSSAEPVESAAKTVLPPPTTYTVRDPAVAAPAEVLDVARPAPERRPARTTARAAQVRPTTRLADLEKGLAEPSAASAAAATTEVASTEAAPAVAGSLPLSNRVIARTIERIGYHCGEIASTTQSETPGVFKVTCTSGHSYQAAPVRGRYHFRRLAGG